MGGGGRRDVALGDHKVLDYHIQGDPKGHVPALVHGNDQGLSVQEHQGYHQITPAPSKNFLYF